MWAFGRNQGGHLAGAAVIVWTLDSGCHFAHESADMGLDALCLQAQKDGGKSLIRNLMTDPVVGLGPKIARIIPKAIAKLIDAVSRIKPFAFGNELAHFLVAIGSQHQP